MAFRLVFFCKFEFFFKFHNFLKCHFLSRRATRSETCIQCFCYQKTNTVLLVLLAEAVEIFRNIVNRVVCKIPFALQTFNKDSISLHKRKQCKSRITVICTNFITVNWTKISLRFKKTELKFPSLINESKIIMQLINRASPGWKW